MGYKKFLGPGSSEWVTRKFLGIAFDIFTGFSCERFLRISADSQERFLGISADFRKIVTWVLNLGKTTSSDNKSIMLRSLESHKFSVYINPLCTQYLQINANNYEWLD